MNETLVLPQINTTVQAAKTFETLGIVGVLFIIIVVLGVLLFYKIKAERNMTELTTKLGEMAITNKTVTEQIAQINAANMQLILTQLEAIRESVDKLEIRLLNPMYSGRRGEYFDVK